MQRAPVSVVIPTFNRRDLVRQAVDSVLAQSLVPRQIIVIDDGSKDDTGERLRCLYGDRINYRRQANAGLSAARNHGIAVASEPFVAFLDDDDAWHPRKIELQMRCFEREPRFGLIGAQQFDWPAESFPPAPGNVAGLLLPVTWKQLVVRTLIPVSSVIVRRDICNLVGGFDVTFRSSEDRDFFLRVTEVALIGILDAPLSGYRDTPGSMCKDPAGREQAMRRILRQFDERDAWRGRWLLRRKAYSCMHNGCSDAHARAGNHWGAVVRQIKSMACYPLPYSARETRMYCERPRRLAVNLLRLLRLKRADRVGATAIRPPTTDALQRLCATAMIEERGPAV